LVSVFLPQDARRVSQIVTPSLFYMYFLPSKIQTQPEGFLHFSNRLRYSL
jgi:hypothetical protein